MSSIDDRAIVNFVQSLGSPSSSGTISANTVPDKVSRRELLARINIEEATLLAEGRPWYEIKASLLQESDKAFIKDLSAERIMKSHLLEAYKKKKSEASRGSTSQAEERVDPTSEKHVDLSLEEPVNPPPVELPKEKKRKSSSGGDKHPKKKKTSSSTEVNTEAGTSQPDVEVSSFIAQPVTSTTMAFFQHFIPPLDVPVVSSTSDKKITEALTSNFLQALIWGGELSRRVTKAREVAHSSKRSLNDVMAKHDKLMKEIEEVRGASDAEKRSLEQKLTDSEASITRIQEEMKKAGEEAEEKIKRSLCSARALSFFQQGFDGCLAQIRDNGYSEAEHPFSFLDVLKSLEALPDDGEAGLSGEK
ncbi:hypothetical protein F511_01653 [Dorcoceras hygrometricum]|nr:hypothetical protein F511_01653 [Dorcoceras hygrometricum]